jgi:hypothetical protein
MPSLAACSTGSLLYLAAYMAILALFGHRGRPRAPSPGAPRVALAPGLAALLFRGFNAQITHEPQKALLVAVGLFPAGKVSDVAGSQPGSASMVSHVVLFLSGDGHSRTDRGRTRHPDISPHLRCVGMSVRGGVPGQMSGCPGMSGLSGLAVSC